MVGQCVKIDGDFVKTDNNVRVYCANLFLEASSTFASPQRIPSGAEESRNTDSTVTMGSASQEMTALLTEHLQYTPLVSSCSGSPNQRTTN